MKKVSSNVVLVRNSLTFSGRVAWFVVIGGLLLAIATQRPAQAITINIEYSDEGDTPPHDENPSWDPAGVILKKHFQQAKQIWESLLLGPAEYEFDFQWDDDIGESTLGKATDLGALDVYIEINPNFNWFADRTPSDDAEFDFTNGQKLYSQLSAAEKSTYFPGTPPPGALEVMYRGKGSSTVPSDSGQAGVNASNGYDLLSVILHEMGHILGIGAEIGSEPGEYNINPQHVGGVVDVLVLEGDGGHLAGDSNVPGFLMNAGTPPGARYHPSATDVLVLAEDQSITSVHLERVGSLSSGFWTNSNGWIGGAVPNVTQDAYILHGGTVNLDADAQAKNLIVGSGSSVNVQHHRLSIDGGLTFVGGTVSINSGGTIAADNIVGDPGALNTQAGTLVRFNEFTRNASSTATSANFNGSVAIGYNIFSNTLSPVFDPSSISVWNIAEQLSIGDANTTSTLAINGGTVITSATGRIGTSLNGGGTGHVNIHQANSSWTIGGMTGALDARNGTLNIFDKGFLQTGSATLGADAGQMLATVNDASWIVNGSVDIGPPAMTGSGRGQLIVQNGGQVTVLGNVVVHGTSSMVSEVTVESAASLEVVGDIIVRQYGKVTYRDATSADSSTFINYGGIFSNGGGGTTQFTDNARATGGTFTNNGGTAGSTPLGGETAFFGASMAANGIFINNGGAGNTWLGGRTIFRDASTAGNGSFTNNGGSGGGQPGYTRFYDNSTAGTATFNNKQGASGGGAVEFYNSSTAGNAIITLQPVVGPSGFAGEILFTDFSNAGNAALTGSSGGVSGGYIRFKGDSTASQATINAGPTTYVQFSERAKAGSSNITISKQSYGTFSNSASAENATISVLAGDAYGVPGGTLQMSGSTGPGGIPLATLGNATITAHGTSAYAAGGGAVYLIGPGNTAGNATITATGAKIPGGYSGQISFDNNGHAGTATLIATSGSAGGIGGLIKFGGGAKGESARLIVNAGATADFGGNRLILNGTSVGSIEGAGTFTLFGGLLTAGGLNTNTTVSGAIIDGHSGYPGGRLTKIGSGQLTLNGTNTYSGLTTVNAGSVAVNGSITGGAVVNSGGTLKGTGTIGGSLMVNAGGVFAPGTSPGTITIAGLNLMSGSTLEYELGATRDRIVLTNNGNVTLGGVLNLSLHDGFNPILGQTFELFEGAIGSITGFFSLVNAPIFNGHTLDLVYTVNHVTLQVIDALLPPGDFNFDGNVNAADYVLWRKNPGGFPANAYDLWRVNFGNPPAAGSGAGIDGGAVPEPATCGLLVCAIIGFLSGRRRRVAI